MSAHPQMWFGTGAPSGVHGPTLRRQDEERGVSARLLHSRAWLPGQTTENTGPLLAGVLESAYSDGLDPSVLVA